MQTSSIAAQEAAALSASAVALYIRVYVMLGAMFTVFGMQPGRHIIWRPAACIFNFIYVRGK
jgi:predicted TIM-barrel enzyme